jgi:hypothetical protein
VKLSYGLLIEEERRGQTSGHTDSHFPHCYPQTSRNVYLTCYIRKAFVLILRIVIIVYVYGTLN